MDIGRVVGRAKRELVFHALLPLAYKLGAIGRHDAESVVLFWDKVPGDLNMGYLSTYLTKHYGIVPRWVSLAPKGDGRLQTMIAAAYKMGKASVIFSAEASLLLGCLPYSKETKVVQLWHSPSAFKKWGLDTADSKFGSDSATHARFPLHAAYSLVSTGAAEVNWTYESAIGTCPSERIKALGMPRTDVFFDAEYIRESKREVLNAIKGHKGRHVILYAPTFRGNVGEAAAPNELDIRLMFERLADDYVLLIKHHPLAKADDAIPSDCASFAFDVRDIAIDKLMMAADCLVTDYSGVIFEYSLLERPMAFFAPDYDEYTDWRGFYYGYSGFVPGPIFTTTEELAQWVSDVNQSFDSGGIVKFREKFVNACDGRSTERICSEIFGPPLE